VLVHYGGGDTVAFTFVSGLLQGLFAPRPTVQRAASLLFGSSIACALYFVERQLEKESTAKEKH